MNFAFYGQAIMTNRTAARPFRAQQLADATARVARHGGTIVAEYFDVYPDRLNAWRHRRQAWRLLSAIEDPQRIFDAIIVGDTATALTGTQYEDLLVRCTEHGVQLWLPEIDEPIDFDNEGHQEAIEDKLWIVPPRRL